MKKYIHKFFILFISFLIILSLCIRLDYNIKSIENGNLFIWTILLGVLYKFINQTTLIKGRRIRIVAFIISILLACFETIGMNINEFLNLNELISSKLLLLKSFIIFIGDFVLLYCFIVNLYSFIESYSFKWRKKLINSNLKAFIISWLICFCAYLPYLLAYYPGNLSPDSIDQLSQALGFSTLNNHHPVLHTLIIRLIIKVGTFIKDYNLGIGLFSIIQMLFVSGVFAIALCYMRKKDEPLIIRLLVILYYALYPIHGIYSITMWKDIPFALSVLLFVIVISKMSIEEDFLKSKKNIFIFILAMILVMLFRNNGIYVLIITFPFILFMLKKYKKQILISFAIVFAIYLCWKMVIFKIFDIKDGSIKEALSVPLQQIARTVRDHEQELNLEEIEVIKKYFSDTNLGEIYSPTISDPVKNAFNDDAFEESKSEFIKLWLNLFAKHPLTYIESFLCNSYGYWYPEASYWITLKGMDSNAKIDGIYTSSKIDSKIVDTLDSFIETREIPILSMLCSIGFAVWILLVLLFYVIYKKNYKLILTFIPILALWLTNLASPVFCEYRYMYSLFTCLPILIGNIFMINRKEENKNG